MLPSFGIEKLPTRLPSNIVSRNSEAPVFGGHCLSAAKVRMLSIVRWPDRIPAYPDSNGIAGPLDMFQAVPNLAGGKPIHELQGRYLPSDDLPARECVHFN